MSLWSLYSAPLLAGNDLRTMTDEIKTILMNAEVIAINQDKAVEKPAQKLSEEGKYIAIGNRLRRSLRWAYSIARTIPAEVSVVWATLGIK